MPTLTNTQVENLKHSINGRVIMPRDADYDSFRSIWNGMIDRKPAAIAQVASAEDIPHAIRFALDNNLELSARGGGHHIAGNSIVENGLTIDFSNMKAVHVDTKNNRALVEPGATLGDLDKATQAHGLAVPTGINSTTGVAGLTLGGGFGWLTRQYGMTIDNLISADLVTADGKMLRVSDNEHPDLFWAIRGGGGNFGVITQFEFQLHPVGPEIYAGLIVFPFNQAAQIMNQYRKFAKSAPEELNVWVVVRHAPPLPFLPESVHSQKVLVLAVFYNGDLEKVHNLADFLRKFGKPVGEHLGTQPYVQWQQAFDPLLTAGARNYWKSHNFTAISDEVIEAMLNYGTTMPTQQCEIFIGMISGKANRIPADATAYSARDARFVMNVHGRWESPKQDDNVINWSREFFRATAPYASDGAYVNFMTEEESDRVRAAYGDNYERLVRIKQKYDPDNLFHMNQNIKPVHLAK